MIDIVQWMNTHYHHQKEYNKNYLAEVEIDVFTSLTLF